MKRGAVQAEFLALCFGAVLRPSPGLSPRVVQSGKRVMMNSHFTHRLRDSGACCVLLLDTGERMGWNPSLPLVQALFRAIFILQITSTSNYAFPVVCRRLCGQASCPRLKQVFQTDPILPKGGRVRNWCLLERRRPLCYIGRIRLKYPL